MEELKKHKAISGAVVIIDDSLTTCTEHGFRPGEVIFGKGDNRILIGIGGIEGTNNKDIWFRREGSKRVCCLPGFNIKRIKDLAK